MIGVFLKPGFFARELLKMPPGAFRPTLLQALAQGCMALAVTLDSLSAKGFAFAVCSQVDDAEIDTQHSIRSIRRWLRNVKRYRQIERPVAVEQVGLPFDGIQARLLIVPNLEGDQYPPRDGQQGNGQESLEGHDTRVKL